MYHLIIHPKAYKELAQSISWYNNQKDGLGERFSDKVFETLALIRLKPEIFGFSKRPFREAGVNIFPFTIVYKVNKEKKEVYISFIYHGKRNPRKKFRS